MKTTNNSKIRELIIKKGENEIKAIFVNNKIYLTKKGMSKVFGITKFKIKRFLEDINDVSNIKKIYNQIKFYNKIKRKNQTFYSLDYIISIGYRLKSFNDTKFILNTNRSLQYPANRFTKNAISNNSNNIFNKFFNVFNKNDYIVV